MSRVRCGPVPIHAPTPLIVDISFPVGNCDTIAPVAAPDQHLHHVSNGAVLPLCCGTRCFFQARIDAKCQCGGLSDGHGTRPSDACGRLLITGASDGRVQDASSSTEVMFLDICFLAGLRHLRHRSHVGFVFEWIQEIDPELVKIAHVAGHDRQPMHQGRRGDHGILQQGV